MGLLSFLRTPAPPAAEAARAPTRTSRRVLWRRGDFTVSPMGTQATAVLRRGYPTQVLPAYAVEFALDCKTFRPLEAHLRHYADLHGWSSLQVQALQGQIPAMVEGGLLVSSDKLRSMGEVLPEAMAPAAISALGFSTGGQRSPTLLRALRSFAQNLREHGRTADLLVSDNSRDEAHSEACRRQLQVVAGELGQRVLFAGPAEKRKFAQQLVARGCAPSAVEFALFNPLGAGFAVGNNRNALLLHTAGHAFASMDDDVVCRLAAPPQRAAEELACATNGDFTARWLFPTAEEATQAPWQEMDFLALHESMLGRSAAELLQGVGEVNFTRLKDAGIRRLIRQRPQVRATFVGQVGDPGIPTSAYYLYYDGENRERLTASEEHYRAVLGSRSVVAMAPTPTLGDSSTSPGMAMGLDNRELLPPFFPVLHAEDFIFGATLWQSVPDSMLGHLPAGIWHDPGSGKSVLLPSQIFAAQPFVYFEFAHLLRLWLLEKTLPERATTEQRLQILGQEMAAAGELPLPDFTDMLGERAAYHVGERTEYLEEQLSDFDGPAFWREDVQDLITFLRRALNSPEYVIPLDLQGYSADPEETRRYMRTLFSRYGELLQAWPAMVQAAQELRKAGTPLMRPV